MTTTIDDVQLDLHEDDTSMFDLLLRRPADLDEALTDEGNLAGAIPKLLGVALAGIGAWGAVIGGSAGYLIEGVGPDAILTVPAALVGAFLGALCICLPSFWFYTQLSGLDASFRLITAHATKVLATTSLLLLGALPIHAILCLSSSLGIGGDGRGIIQFGMVLPFIFGLRGLQLLYRAFSDLAERLPHTHERRGDYVRRMVMCWGMLYTAVAPVALYRLVDILGIW